MKEFGALIKNISGDNKLLTEDIPLIIMKINKMIKRDEDNPFYIAYKEELGAINIWIGIKKDADEELVEEIIDIEKIVREIPYESYIRTKQELDKISESMEGKTISKVEMMHSIFCAFNIYEASVMYAEVLNMNLNKITTRLSERDLDKYVKKINDLKELFAEEMMSILNMRVNSLKKEAQELSAEYNKYKSRIILNSLSKVKNAPLNDTDIKIQKQVEEMLDDVWSSNKPNLEDVTKDIFKKILGEKFIYKEDDCILEEKLDILETKSHKIRSCVHFILSDSASKFALENFSKIYYQELYRNINKMINSTRNNEIDEITLFTKAKLIDLANKNYKNGENTKCLISMFENEIFDFVVKNKKSDLKKLITLCETYGLSSNTINLIELQKQKANIAEIQIANNGTLNPHIEEALKLEKELDKIFSKKRI